MTKLLGIKSDDEFVSLIDREAPLGEGTGRRVYAVIGCTDVVIKESKAPFHYANFVEWTVWNALVRMGEDIIGNRPNADLKQLFAECFSISHSAKYLMMERLQKFEAGDAPPLTRLPFWTNDKKPSAFGKTAAGEVKVIDYGMVNFYDALNPENRKPLF
ncbi:hypothetical protein J2X36_003571 [Methylobacterium sp. BE186]|uniref:hypothetical protein n=1 Tax=Methylobacterium sp. BE186 TaxID=2817715 RepID=UPI00285A496A|nr:hypothetical protein [Methylobacterium sp. BE186]MDR7038800.1 hypothetical protein [Methylobacterium sp. BE186]